jgi:predicted ester cyclase
MAPVDRGEQGRRGQVVHGVLGQRLQPGRHRRARRPGHPVRVLAARAPAWSDAVRSFAQKFRAAFPDLGFWGTADLIAEGDYVVGQWEGGGTHTGEAFDDMPVGALPANTGKTMRFTGTTVLTVENGLITEEVGLDDGVTVLRQLGLITEA